MSKNKYLYPVKLSKDIKIDYDSSPAHKERLKHAVDFICKEGNKIFASASGVVVDIKQNSNIGGKTKEYDKYSNYIEIKHKNEEYFIYEHIKKNGSVVNVGDIVKSGQLIGYSGNTGFMAHLGPHLHFDVHIYYGNGSEDYKTIKINWKN